MRSSNEAQRLETIVTDSVVEALALENHLIKQRVPKYNILLRDDKNYPYLQLTTGEPFPRVLVARRVEKDDHFYAGPSSRRRLARRTMSLSHKLFGIRSCSEVITGDRARPCLEYDIKRCVAPCVREICGPDEYGVAVEHTRLFLEGRNEELVSTLKGRMVAGRGRRGVRARRAVAGRDPHDRDAEEPAAEDGHARSSATAMPSASSSVPPARSSRSSRFAAARSSSGSNS